MTLIRAFMFLVLLTSWASAVVDEEGCKRHYGAGSPEGAIVGYSACDRYMNTADGAEYEFHGVSGTMVGWVRSAPADPACGDGIINQADEQCDPGPPESQGVCASPGQCLGDCTCSPAPPTCNDGTLDAGEECDPSAPDSPCQQNCNADCTCNTTCGDGIEDPTEECDPNVTSGTNFGTALDFQGSTARFKSNDTAFELGASNDIVIETFLEVDAVAATQSIVDKYYVGDVGFDFQVLSGGTLAFHVDAEPSAGDDACFSTPNIITAGTRYHIAMTWDHSLGECNFWVLDIDASETTHTQRDGADDNTDTGTVPDGAYSMRIGAAPPSGANPLDGRLDELRVRIGPNLVSEFESTILESSWNQTISCAAVSGLTGYWSFDGTSSTSVTNCVSGNTDIAEGSGWQRVSSPFSAGSTACPSGEICKADCTCSTPAPTACTYYVAASGGDDTGPGTSANPWATFARALSTAQPTHVRAGDVLCAKNGTYTQNVIAMRCPGATSANAEEGTSASLPIIIKAENDRQAWIKSNGTVEAILLDSCEYVTVDGFVAEMTASPQVGVGACDGGPATVQIVRGGTGVIVKNVTSYKTNTTENAHTVSAYLVDGVLIDHVEAYNTHRAGISVFQSRNVTVRDSYVNQRGVTSSCYPTSQDGISAYASSYVTVENSIVENGTGPAFKVISGTGIVGGGHGGVGNAFRGVISYNNYGAFDGESRCWDRRAVKDTVIRDMVGVRTVSGGFNAFDFRAVASTDARQVTLTGWQGTLDGVNLRQHPSNTCSPPCTGVSCGSWSTPPSDTSIQCDELWTGSTCGGTFTNILSWNHGGSEIESDGNQSGTCTFTEVALGSGGTNSLLGDCSVSPTPDTTAVALMGTTGTLCITHVPTGETCCDGTGDGGADIGADVRCRWVDGVKLTSAAGASANMWNQSAPIPVGDCTSGDAPCRNAFIGCGPIVTGVNDTNGNSCFDVHERLNLDVGGCSSSSACP